MAGFNSNTGTVPSAGGALMPSEAQKLTGQVTAPHLLPGYNTTYYGASGAIKEKSGMVVINKGGIAVMTIAAPAAADDGLQLVITSTTGSAHTVTGVALLADGASGSPHSTATWVAAIGGTMTLVACNQVWNVQALQGVSVA